VRLLEHKVPICLMRRCLYRLSQDVAVAKLVYREKEGKLQQARTRERNAAIEAAGAQKRGKGLGGKGVEDESDDESDRRPLRHQAKLAALKAKEKATSDPAEMRQEVEVRQQQLDDFSRVLKRKQADLVMMENEFEPLQRQELEQQQQQALEGGELGGDHATGDGGGGGGGEGRAALVDAQPSGEAGGKPAKAKRPAAAVAAVGKAGKARPAASADAAGRASATPPGSKRMDAAPAKGKRPGAAGAVIKTRGPS
jgi:hypothetical protein